MTSGGRHTMCQPHSWRRRHSRTWRASRRQAAGLAAALYLVLIAAAVGVSRVAAEPQQRAGQERRQHAPAQQQQRQRRQQRQPDQLLDQQQQQHGQHSTVGTWPSGHHPGGVISMQQHRQQQQQQQHGPLGSAQVRRASRRLAAADTAAWQALGADAAGLGSMDGGRARALLQTRAEAKAPDDEVVISSPADNINTLTTQFFKVDFGGRTVEENPLRLLAIDGASRWGALIGALSCGWHSVRTQMFCCGHVRPRSASGLLVAEDRHSSAGTVAQDQCGVCHRGRRDLSECNGP